MNQRYTNKRFKKNMKQLTRKNYGGAFPENSNFKTCDSDEESFVTEWLENTDIITQERFDSFYNKNSYMRQVLLACLTKISNNMNSPLRSKAKLALSFYNTTTNNSIASFATPALSNSETASWSSPSVLKVNEPLAQRSKPMPPNSKCILLVDQWLNQRNTGTKIAEKGKPTAAEYEAFLTKNTGLITRSEADACLTYANVSPVPSFGSVPTAVPEPTSTPVSVPTPTSVPETTPTFMPTPNPVPEPTTPPEPEPTPAPAFESVAKSVSRWRPENLELPASTNEVLDVEDTLRDLAITVDVKVTQIPNNVPGQFGPPSVELSILDYNVLSNLSSSFINDELKLSEELKTAMAANPVKIDFTITNKLSQVVEELKIPKDQSLKTKTDKIINYLNTKKQIADIKSEINKFSSSVMKNEQNIKSILEKYQTTISELNKMNPDTAALTAISTENASQIDEQYASNVDTILHSYIDKLTFNITLILLEKAVGSNNIVDELQKKKQPIGNVNDLLKLQNKNVAGGSKNLKQTVQKVQQLMNTKLGGKNLVMDQLKQIRGESV
jgi:hypothetical protein